MSRTRARGSVAGPWDYRFEEMAGEAFRNVTKYGQKVIAQALEMSPQEVSRRCKGHPRAAQTLREFQALARHPKTDPWSLVAALLAFCLQTTVEGLDSIEDVDLALRKAMIAEEEAEAASDLVEARSLISRPETANLLSHEQILEQLPARIREWMEEGSVIGLMVENLRRYELLGAS